MRKLINTELVLLGLGAISLVLVFTFGRMGFVYWWGYIGKKDVHIHIKF